MKNVLFLIISGLLLTSCMRQISSDVYASRQVGEVSVTYRGVIQNCRGVYASQESSGVGVAGGGIAGGVVGTAIGRGNVLGTVAGAVAGAMTGSLVEKNLKKQHALEYIVKLDDGQLLTIVQGHDQVFNIGQPVYVIVSQAGRSRIVPQSGS